MSHPIGEQDLYLFNEGTHARLYNVLGCHAAARGAHFAVWAPSAREVAVIGDWNGWRPGAGDYLHPQHSSGIWAGTIDRAEVNRCYKYRIVGPNGEVLEKADPFGFGHEQPPKTASVVTRLDYAWGDQAWLQGRGARQSLRSPISIYEVHLGSWRRSPATPHLHLPYRELAQPLARHARDHGFTHVELMPITEHPFYGSWGYQVTGFFAPTARYGTPQDFMYLVDTLHQHGLGVILDWVPGHFPTDPHGLYRFDGTHLYEHADPRSGFHPDWNTAIFNYGRHEVRSFLLSSALFWLDRYHIDGLRVDGVASMLYLDYSRKAGEWIPNRHGGRENLDAIDFLQRMNERVYAEYPDVQTYAEESTAWPMVSRPTSVGGLGFGLKWDMGWMHDTLEYVKRDPIHRRYHHHELTFRAVYAWNENFVLPLSHDEVVHGKGSLYDRMPGDSWQKLANLRLLYAYQFAVPGKKLLFMGNELGQGREWNHEHSLDWHLLDEPAHAGVGRAIADLNRLYRELPALHVDCDPGGFAWIEMANADDSILAFERRGPGGERLVAAMNFTPVPRSGHPLGVEHAGGWREVFNSDAAEYGGSGFGNLGRVTTESWSSHGRPHTLRVNIPPLGAVFFIPEAG